MGVSNAFGLDLPRQAVYNFGKGANDILSGNGSMESVGRMAPGAIGALLMALMGPGAAVLGSGAAQGLGNMIGGEDYAAPGVADLVDAMGGDAADPFLMTGVNMATDPVNWLAGSYAMRGGRTAMDAIRNGTKGFPHPLGPKASPLMAMDAIQNTGASDLATAAGLMINSGDDLVNLGAMGAGMTPAKMTPAREAFERRLKRSAMMGLPGAGVMGAGLQPGPAMGGM